MVSPVLGLGRRLKAQVTIRGEGMRTRSNMLYVISSLGTSVSGCLVGHVHCGSERMTTQGFQFFRE